MHMEPGEVDANNDVGNLKESNGLSNLLVEASAAGHQESIASQRFDFYGVPVVPPFSGTKRSKVSPNVSQEIVTSPTPSVSSCYVFKSQLQEYAQKVKLPTPTYYTVKEGPSHEPTFRSTVILDDVRYDSLPGFFNRKAAEQSAAEVALVALANAGAMDEGISQPVHDTGLCKNLLQEYAQKMNYAIPSYECIKVEKLGLVGHFTCTVDIGGIKYIGGAARTKKEAELKAARTALLAIQSDPYVSDTKLNANSMYTVLPGKKKVSDLNISSNETAAALKPKKGRFKKKRPRKRRHKKDKNKQDGNLSGGDKNVDN